VFGFILAPLKTENVNIPALHGQAISKNLKNLIKEIEKESGKRLFEAAMRFYILLLFI